MKEQEFQKIICELWDITKSLEIKYKKYNRKFTIDGHLLGSIGEIYASEKFNLILLPNSEKTHDAKDNEGDYFQIKTTQLDKIRIKNEPDNLIVIKVNEDGKPIIEYKGNMKNIWKKIKHLKSDYKQISIKSIKTA